MTGILRRLPLGRLHARMPLWLRLALAAATLALGVVIVIRPTTSLDVLALLLGGGMVLTGILELTGRANDERPTWPALGRLGWLTGIVWIAAGAFVLLWPGLTVRLVAVLVGILLLVNGAIGVLSAFRRNRGWDTRIADAAFGIAGLLFGVLALTWPDITLLVVAVVFGASLIMRGVADLWTALRRRRADRVDAGAVRPAQRTAARPRARWGRTVLAMGSVALAVAAALVSAPLHEVSTVVDDFYAAPRDAPDEPGHLVRAEEFTRDVPTNARGWRILYTTTGVDGEVRVASGLVVVPVRDEDDDSDAPWPVIDWNHGTTGFAEHCAPSLQEKPFASGAMYILRKVVAEGWALVATDYIGLGTEGPHPYLTGRPSATASLDAVRAAWELQEANLSRVTVIWGHSQGGGAALWAGSIANTYAPQIWVRGVAALAPASDPAALVANVTRVTGGSIFASFAFASYSALDPRITYRDYIRPGAQTVVRAMSERCLSDPGTVVSVLAALGMSTDPDLFAERPTSGRLGVVLRANAAPEWIGPPVFLGQGGSDSVIAVSTQDTYVDRLCAEGQTVDYRVYDGFEHAAVVEGYSPLVDDLIGWTRARFAGEVATRECTRTEG